MLVTAKGVVFGGLGRRLSLAIVAGTMLVGCGRQVFLPTPVTSEEIPGGALIHLTTTEPRRVEELRGRLRDRVVLLGRKTCSF